MTLKISTQNKTLPTFFAGVRLLSSLCKDVIRQIFSFADFNILNTSSCSGCRIMFTMNMVPELCRASKAPPTFLARVWLLSRVSTNMIHQMISSLGRVRTVVGTDVTFCFG